MVQIGSMKVAEFLLGSLPLLIQFYADLYRKIDFENTMHELESKLNVPKSKTYDFIIGKCSNLHEMFSFRLLKLIKIAG